MHEMQVTIICQQCGAKTLVPIALSGWKSCVSCGGEVRVDMGSGAVVKGRKDKKTRR